jgi:glycosyltransferase involved in cell wall biosynthesis
MPNMSISAVVLTKNEEKNIEDCLKTLSFCDEIIVVDDNSVDLTPNIAKKISAKVFSRDMNMNYAEQSNFGMEKAANEWVLFIDADERVTEQLKNEILTSIKNFGKEILVFKFKRVDYMWGKWLRHGEIGTFLSPRLVKKGPGKWKRRVHPYYSYMGLTKVLNNPILHYPHPTLESFIASVNRWSTWHAIANYEEKKRSNLFKIVFFPIAHFIKNYIFRFGFLDGMRGFVFAMMMSFHSLLSWGKLFILQKKGLTKIPLKL